MPNLRLITVHSAPIIFRSTCTGGAQPPVARARAPVCPGLATPLEPSHKKFPEGKQVHVGMEATKTNYILDGNQRHHNTNTHSGGCKCLEAIYHNSTTSTYNSTLAKERLWAEQLTSPPKRGSGSSFTRCLQYGKAGRAWERG